MTAQARMAAQNTMAGSNDGDSSKNGGSNAIWNGRQLRTLRHGGQDSWLVKRAGLDMWLDKLYYISKL